MQLHPNNFVLIVSAVFLSLIPAFGQEKPVQPVKPPPVQTDPVNPSEKVEKKVPEKGTPAEEVKLGYVRIWNLAGRGDTLRTGIFLKKKGDDVSNLLWLGRGVRYGTFQRYREVPEGAYELVIMSEPAGDYDPEKEVKFDSSMKNETTGVEIIVKQNDYQTLLIKEEAKKLKPTLMNDREGKSGMHALRGFNFTDTNQVSLVQVQAGNKTPIFSNMEKDKMFTKEFSGSGKIQVEMVYVDENGNPLAQSGELDPNAVMSASMVVYYDRYNRITMRCMEDAPNNP